jgi:hypothetical protein
MAVFIGASSSVGSLRWDGARLEIGHGFLLRVRIDGPGRRDQKSVSRM